MPKKSKKKRFKYLKTNAVQCRGCGMTLISLHRHDFVNCDCPKDSIFIDGGFDYTRWGGKPEKFFPVPLYYRVEA